MSAIAKTTISQQKYLELERQAPRKSEYYKGEMFAMARATKEHNKIVASIILSTGSHLKEKECSLFASDIRVYNPLNGFYTYPDVTVVCGEEEYLDDKFDTLLNPTVIFEVLSASTEDYDRGTKFKLYRSIPSLRNYVLISSTEYAAEVFTKEDEKWILNTAKERDDYLHISALTFNLKMADVYAQIKHIAAEL